jgi:hypothetical protein
LPSHLFGHRGLGTESIAREKSPSPGTCDVDVSAAEMFDAANLEQSNESVLLDEQIKPIESGSSKFVR